MCLEREAVSPKETQEHDKKERCNSNPAPIYGEHAKNEHYGAANSLEHHNASDIYAEQLFRAFRQDRDGNAGSRA